MINVSLRLTDYKSEKTNIDHIAETHEGPENDHGNDHDHRLAEQFLAGGPGAFQQFDLYLMDKGFQISDALY
jgi:hypothetical protein